RKVRDSVSAGLGCGSVEEAALFQFWHLLATNQLKIFASLSMFLEEYRSARSNRRYFYVPNRWYRGSTSWRANNPSPKTMMNSGDGGRVAPMGPAVGCGDG